MRAWRLPATSWRAWRRGASGRVWWIFAGEELRDLLIAASHGRDVCFYFRQWHAVLPTSVGVFMWWAIEGGGDLRRHIVLTLAPPHPPFPCRIRRHPHHSDCHLIPLRRWSGSHQTRRCTAHSLFLPVQGIFIPQSVTRRVDIRTLYLHPITSHRKRDLYRPPKSLK